jgi:predicted transcriptional regulator
LPASNKTFMELKKKVKVKEELTELVKQQAKMKKMVLNAFEDEPKTVPEVAKALNSATYEAMYWVMALRKYGFIEETDEVTDDGYYKYRLVEKKS